MEYLLPLQRGQVKPCDQRVKNNQLKQSSSVLNSSWKISRLIFSYSGVEENWHRQLLRSMVLYQNYPNPFNPSTTIEFSLPVRSHVVLRIFNILGEEIEVLVNGELEVGEHLINWEAKNLPSGIYFYRLITDNFNTTRKMILLR